MVGPCRRPAGRLLPTLDRAHVGFPAQVEKLLKFLDLVGRPGCLRLGGAASDLDHSLIGFSQNLACMAEYMLAGGQKVAGGYRHLASSLARHQNVVAVCWLLCMRDIQMLDSLLGGCADYKPRQFVLFIGRQAFDFLLEKIQRRGQDQTKNAIEHLPSMKIIPTTREQWLAGMRQQRDNEPRLTAEMLHDQVSIAKRKRGRPRKVEERPWQAEGISRSKWYRSRRA